MSRFLGPASAAAVVLIQTLISLAEVRRPLFVVGSVAGLVLTLALTGWYAAARDTMRAIAAFAGAVLVGGVAWLGMPSTERVQAGAISQPTPAPSFDGPNDEVVVEEPSEAEAIFDRAIVATTPWYNEILNLYPSATVEDAEGEAALLGAWWALADWCRKQGHGSEGRCYDLAALYVGEAFDRDPRSINTETWHGAGAIGGVVAAGYDNTAKYVRVAKSSLLPDLFMDRPGVNWECEPSCTGAKAAFSDK
jgi:hypothetical protein